MLTKRLLKFFDGLFLLKHRTSFIVFFESCLVLFSLVLAWLLRFDFRFPDSRLVLQAAPLLVVIRLLLLARFNLLHGWWRYAGIDEALDICKAVAQGSILFAFLLRIVVDLTAFPISIYFIEAVLTACTLGGVRLLSRVMVESLREDSSASSRVALIGAGFAGQMIIREVNRAGSEYSVVACFDDDSSKQRIKLLGVPVVGTVDQLPSLIRRWAIDEILIAVPSATGAQMRRFVEICEATGLRFRTIPTLLDLIDGKPTIQQIREVKVEDLLGRQPADIDLESVRKHIRHKIVMVTGAAGSIGSELSRQVLEYDPAKLICVDHNETGMFFLERELSRRWNGSRVVYSVANIGEVERMHKLCSSHAVEMLFHAAAYKHVPVMETNVQEAVNNNVFGLLRLLNVAEETGCKCFVMISSDKAVNPTSIMGCTKRIGELIISAWPTDGMRAVSVRFGNVLGSSGSVIPVFREQLSRDEPITITHPEIERFFMTVSEAVALVLQASAIGQHGDILVLDMGEPVRIVDLAHTLIRLSGKSPENTEIKFTGLRQGEKLFEELFYPHEEIQATSCTKIKRANITVRQWPELRRHLEELNASLFVDGADPVRRKLKQIVPECRFGEVAGPPTGIAAGQDPTGRSA